jgi:hypothetical protein
MNKYARRVVVFQNERVALNASALAETRNRPDAEGAVVLLWLPVGADNLLVDGNYARKGNGQSARLAQCNLEVGACPMLASEHMPLLERLRKGANCIGFLDGAPEPAADVADMLRKAADEIERLKSRIAELEK